MYDHQRNRLPDIKRLVGIFGEQNNHQRQMPGMLGIIF